MSASKGGGVKRKKQQKLLLSTYLERENLSLGIKNKDLQDLLSPINEINSKNESEEKSADMMDSIYQIAGMKNDVIDTNDIAYFKHLAPNTIKLQCNYMESVYYYAACSLHGYNCNSTELIILTMANAVHKRSYLTYEFIEFLAVFLLGVKFYFESKLHFISSFVAYLFLF